MESIEDKLRNFDPSKGGRYDPGQVVVFFDHRAFKSAKDRLPSYQSYWLSTKYRLGWPSIWWTTDLEPGKLRLIWYTHAGNEGAREYPLHMAYKVKEMYDSLAEEGFRPMIMGWSAENPFPMIGGSEPPPEPKKPKMKVAKTYSATVSGHSEVTGTPHDRVMAIINREEEKEAERRKKEVDEFAEGEKV